MHQRKFARATYRRPRGYPPAEETEALLWRGVAWRALDGAAPPAASSFGGPRAPSMGRPGL